MTGPAYAPALQATPYYDHGVDAIDPGSGVPPYLQLAGILREKITSGELAGPLPSQRELAGTYGLAGKTVAKALAVLRQENLIVTFRGWGSRTAGHPPQ